MQTKLMYGFFCALFALALPILASAHQPRLVETERTSVPDPEISKAYYGELGDEAEVYTIFSGTSFNLYVNILVPDIEGQSTEVNVAIVNSETNKTLATFTGNESEWERMWEEFGRDWYLQGPEFRETVKAGSYEVRVSSAEPDTKYVLAIGEKEAFDAAEAYHAVTLIPYLKKEFFETSPATFLLSPFGWGFALVMYIFAFVLAWVLHKILSKVYAGTSRGAPKNVGKKDRIIRAGVAVGLFVFAVFTCWHPLLFLVSGIVLYTAIRNWCWLYSLINVSTWRKF